MSALQTKYRTEIVPKLQEKLGGRNVHAVPKVEKVVISMGLGKSVGERKRLEEAVEQLGLISGQKPRITRARKAISGFRLREGMEIGCAVTLRSKRMYEFLGRLIHLVLPRVRDFRGVNGNGFDGRGNFSMGLAEQMVFPELNPDKVSFVQGMNIAVVTTAKTDEEGRQLLQELGFPFKKE
ncbi:MAG TPA: 50S ribosomal protein L5 [Schlesneria sp.]|jgi:large subunit ribosomal protein L5